MINNKIIGVLDWLIFAGSLLATWLLGQFGKHKTSNNIIETWLMGRQLTLPFFIATLVATWYGGINVVSQTAFEQGIYNFFTQGVCWYLAYLIFAKFIAHKIQQTQVLSFSEFISQRYGNAAGKLAIVLTFLKSLPCIYVLSLAVFIQWLVPMPLPYSAAIGLIFVYLYSNSGFRAVVYTDMLQCGLMLTGICAVPLYSLYYVGGWDFLSTSLPPHYFKICGSNSPLQVIMWLFIAFSSTLLSPGLFQRCLAAKTPKTASIGIYIATGIWIMLDLAITLGAMYAKAVMPHTNSIYAYFDYALALLPQGLKGIFLASISATLLSTIDSMLLIANNTLMYDLPKAYSFNINKKITPTYSLLLITAITWILACYCPDNLESIWILNKSILTPTLIIPVGWALVSKQCLHASHFLINFSLSIIAVLCCYVFMPAPLNNTCAYFSGMAISITTLAFGKLFSARHASNHM